MSVLQPCCFLWELLTIRHIDIDPQLSWVAISASAHLLVSSGTLFVNIEILMILQFLVGHAVA
jgi:hypothetical protein